MAKVVKDFIKKTTKGAGEMTQWFKSAHCSCKSKKKVLFPQQDPHNHLSPQFQDI